MREELLGSATGGGKRNPHREPAVAELAEWIPGGSDSYCEERPSDTVSALCDSTACTAESALPSSNTRQFQLSFLVVGSRDVDPRVSLCGAVAFPGGPVNLQSHAVLFSTSEMQHCMPGTLATSNQGAHPFKHRMAPRRK